MFLFLYLEEVADTGLACASAMPVCACSMLHVPFHASFTHSMLVCAHSAPECASSIPVWPSKNTLPMGYPLA